MSANPSVRGQIASIYLKNFMSYDEVTLLPGSQLNFIIGPNGTGKSTFVCAVIIGLGGKLRTLGRGDYLSSFVKIGTRRCVIQIELYDPAEGNILIKRVITRDNTSEYFIGEEHATLAQVAEVRDHYNIQLDNLCTFLPQEKVQDFSTLNPQELLCQTQKIAGDSDMVETYERLKEFRMSITDKEKRVGILEKNLEDKKQKNERIKDKVQAYKESKILSDRLTSIKQKKSWIAYCKESEKLIAVKSEFNSMEREHGRVEEQHNILSEEIEKLEKSIITDQENYLRAEKESSTKKLQLQSELKKFKKNVQLLEGFKGTVEARLAEEENKRKELKLAEENLDKLKNDLVALVSKNGTDEELKAKEEEVHAEIVSNHKEESNMLEKKLTLEDELGQIKTDIQNTSMEYRLLEKRRNFRLEFLKRCEPDTYKSVEWLKEHRQLFRGRIYNPMLLELDVTDVKYAKYVETYIPYRDLIAFTCTNNDDLNLLIQKLRRDMNLDINVVCSEDDRIDHYEPEFPLDEIRSFGFYIYMKDCVTGPKHIIRYLCQVYKIHLVPIGDDTVEMNCDETPTKMRVFFSETNMFNVKISHYSGEKSIAVKQLEDPKLFTVPLDNEKIKQIIDKEKQLITQRGEKEMKLKLATHFFKTLADKQEELRRQKRNIATLRSEHEHIVSKIERAERKTTEMRNAVKDPAVVLEELDNQRKELNNECAAALKKVRRMHEEVFTLIEEAQNYDLKCRINRRKLYDMMDTKDSLLADMHRLEDKLNRLKAKRQATDENCTQLCEEAKRLTDGLMPGEKGFEKFDRIFEILKNTIEELEREQQDIQVVAEFITGGDAEMVIEYEKREHEIMVLSNELKETTAILQQCKDTLVELRERWIAPITDLVSKINQSFSNFFRNMDCTGTVSLSHGADMNDVEEYGISIKVQFRREMPMHDLGRHFQSGGERAIATAVYLLSLQQLMNAPFRFVDEINQGMDSANEKRMVELMINVTDKNNPTQYFFITPKLLPDVKTSDSMVVHCVFSGKHAIPSKDWDLDSVLSRH